MTLYLSAHQLYELERAGKHESSTRRSDRIKAIRFLNKGLSYEYVSELLLLDDQTIRNYVKSYTSGGIEALLNYNYKGGIPKLSPAQEEKLIDHLRENQYLAAKEIVEYVKNCFEVVFTPEGMVHTLHRLGFTYKKTSTVPGKADSEKQIEFVKGYEKLKEEKEPEAKILFMDGVHPQHNSKPAYCWIEKGKMKELPTNTGRKRININGVLDAETIEVTITESESINAQSTIELLQKVELKYNKAPHIYIISDNASYYRSKLVKAYLENSRIEIKFLPSYSPNLNLIERLWKFFYKKKLYNRYYDTYDKFKTECLNFFDNINTYKGELRTLLVDNFQIIGSQLSKT